MRQLCENLLRIDVRKLDFRPDQAWQYPPPNGIAISVVGDAVHVIHGTADFYVDIQRTACNYGGSRYWFSCPRCGDRRAVLYDDGERTFGCRRCMHLRYASESEDIFDRLRRKCRKLEAKLGDAGDKPKWMRFALYDQIHFQRAAAEAKAVRWLTRRFHR